MAKAGTTRARVSRRAAEEAVRTLLRWAGEDPVREGLLETPKRVVNAYRDWFSGYAVDPREYMRRRIKLSLAKWPRSTCQERIPSFVNFFPKSLASICPKRLLGRQTTLSNC